MRHWTEQGWELLKRVAFNAALKSGFESTAEKVISDAFVLTGNVVNFPYGGHKIQNIYGEDRYYSVFNLGKVAIWKVQDEQVIFVGAFSSLPEKINI